MRELSVDEVAFLEYISETYADEEFESNLSKPVASKE